MSLVIIETSTSIFEGDVLTELFGTRRKPLLGPQHSIDANLSFIIDPDNVLGYARPICRPLYSTEESTNLQTGFIISGRVLAPR